MTANMYMATAAWLFLFAGLCYRRHREVHVPLMLTAIFMDTALVLWLQWQRQAIQTAFAFTLSPLQQAHVGVSTLALCFYAPVVWLGCRLYKQPGDSELRMRHRRLAIAAFCLRTAGFVLMFSMLR